MDSIHRRCRALNVPYSALMELTYACNLKCFHCYNTHRSRPEMNTAQLVDAMGQLAGLGCLHLTLSGGEVYCRPDFETLAAAGKRMGFALYVFSNATRVTPEQARFLARLGIVEFSTSVFAADAAVHDAITRVPGSLEKTRRGLRHLQAAGVRTRVKCLIMKPNLEYYRGVLDFARCVGAACGFDTTLMPGGGNDLSVLSERLDEGELKRVLSDPDVYYIADTPPPYDGSHPATGNREDLQLVCGAGVTHLSIDPYGQVFTCVQQLHPAGSLKHDSLRAIWTSAPGFTQARSVTRDSLAACSGCRHSGTCARCPALAQKEDGDILGPSSHACRTSAVVQSIFKERFAPAPGP